MTDGGVLDDCRAGDGDEPDGLRIESAGTLCGTKYLAGVPTAIGVEGWRAWRAPPLLLLLSFIGIPLTGIGLGGGDGDVECECEFDGEDSGIKKPG